MKHLNLIVIVAWVSLAIQAQTNVAPSPGSTTGAATSLSTTPAVRRAPTRIDSDSLDFDKTAHQMVYRGHVMVDDPQMKLTCALLTTDLPESGGRPSRIDAETNVVIDFFDDKGQPNHATSDRAIYVFNVQNGVTNETITFTGNARIENAQGTLTGEPIYWDRANNHLHADNENMVFRQNLTSVMANTNPPAAEATNLPPGTNAVIDRNTNSPAGADF